MTDRNDQSSRQPPTMSEVLDVLRPQVEKIEGAFHSIRVTLDALAEHVQGLGNGISTGARKEPADAARREIPDKAPANATPTPSARPMSPLNAEIAKDKSPPVGGSGDPHTTRRDPHTTPVVAATTSVELPPPVGGSGDLPTTVAATTPGGSGGLPRTPVVAVATPVPPAPAAPAVAAIRISPAGEGGNWSQIIFGDQLRVDPSMSSLSGTLLADVYDGRDAAIGMMGQLLSFRAAGAERKPRLLKDMGEAFYEWKPQGNDTLRDALVVWIHAVLDRDGITNRLEIVQAGDRYDMHRHNSRDRGVEVAGVNGWVVLRENGRVYSKANVSVK